MPKILPHVYYSPSGKNSHAAAGDASKVKARTASISTEISFKLSKIYNFQKEWTRVRVHIPFEFVR